MSATSHLGSVSRAQSKQCREQQRQAGSDDAHFYLFIYFCIWVYFFLPDLKDPGEKTVKRNADANCRPSVFCRGGE